MLCHAVHAVVMAARRAATAGACDATSNAAILVRHMDRLTRSAALPNRAFCSHEWRQLLFTACYMHSVVQERRKFGPIGALQLVELLSAACASAGKQSATSFILLPSSLPPGWNIPYDFSQGDLAAVTQFLQVHHAAAGGCRCCCCCCWQSLSLRGCRSCCCCYCPACQSYTSPSHPLSAPPSLPQTHISDMDARRAAQPDWPTVRYMIADIQYAGRITDDFDRLLMVRGRLRLLAGPAEGWEVALRVAAGGFGHLQLPAAAPSDEHAKHCRALTSSPSATAHPCPGHICGAILPARGAAQGRTAVP